MADDWSIEESQVVVGPEVQDIKLFGKWSADEVQVGDISLTVGIYKILGSNYVAKLRRRTRLLDSELDGF